jgi:hypothetical protein
MRQDHGHLADPLGVKLARFSEAAAKRSVTLDEHPLEFPRATEQRPLCVDEAEKGPHGCRIPVEGTLHSGDLPLHGGRKASAISPPNHQPQMRT